MEMLQNIPLEIDACLQDMDDLPKTYASALLELAENNDLVDEIHGNIDTLNVRIFQHPETYISFALSGTSCHNSEPCEGPLKPFQPDFL